MARGKSVHFEALDDDGDDENVGGIKGMLSSIFASASSLGKWAKSNAKWALKKGLYAGWVIATATMITAMPLLFELQREQVVIEMEKAQVKELLAQGYPPSQLQQMGLTLEPSVLNPTPSAPAAPQ